METKSRKKGVMAKWLCKLTRSKGQVRLTIPNGLVREAKLYDWQYVVLDRPEGGEITIRRLTGGETFEGELKKHPINGN